MAICLAFRLEGQFAPGGRQIWALELAGLAPGSMPAGLQIISGGGVVVAMKDGVAMLKAAAVTEFEVSLPEKLPDQFTLQFEIIPKRCCNPDDLFFAGTSSKGQGGNSAEFGWHRDHLTVTGGGRPHTFTSDMPPDLRDALPAALTSIDVSFEGETVKLYTNGKRLFTLTERRFARGQVVRVRLGGQDPDDQAVYLAKLRVGTGPPIIAQQPPAPPPSPLSVVLMPPPPPPTATGMVTPAPPPPAPEPVRTPTASTTERVPSTSGTTAGAVAAAERAASLTVQPREFVLAGFEHLVTPAALAAPRSFVLGGFAVSAPLTGPPPEPRAFALEGFTALATLITVAPRITTTGELPGTTVTGVAQPRAFTLQGFSTTAAPVITKADPKSFTLSGFTVTAAPAVAVLPKSFKLTGFVTASP
jgi:hypothetical protein